MDLEVFISEAEQRPVISGDPEKVTPSQSVIEETVSVRLKCFKLCSVTKRLPYFLVFLQFVFSTVDSPNEGFCGKGHA